MNQPRRLLVVSDDKGAQRIREVLESAAPGRWVVTPAGQVPEAAGLDAVVIDAGAAQAEAARRHAQGDAAVLLLAPSGEGYPEDALCSGVALVLPPSASGDVLDAALSCAIFAKAAQRAAEEEREKLRAQVEESERTASLGTLSAGISHEINNPLASVVANLSLLASELPSIRERPGTLGDLLEAVAEAQRGAERVAQIVRGLRMFSRGGDDERRGLLDVAQVVEAALHLAAGELRHRARVVRELQPVPRVEASEPHLTQVFVNLILNAAQSIPEGAAERNEVRIAIFPGRRGEVIAEVRDTGAGMSPEVLARIFDPFFTTRPVGTGTGLGLSICQGIVASLGGRIQASSEAGKGSRFRVTLPAVKEDAPQSPKAPAAARRGRVLLVEDDPLVARAVRRTLGSEHDVTVVDGGRAALTALASGDFDVVLCDLMMPQMTGMDLHEELARSRPEIAARMVFLSGGAFTDAAREFLARVPNAQVEKPFDPSHLRDVVRRLVAS